MSKVLTWKEYKKLEKGSVVDVPVNIIEERPEEVPSPVATPAESSKIYILMYPDNPVNNYYSGTYIVGGKEFSIVDGILKTDDFETRTELIKQGFLLLQTKDKEVE